MSKYTAASDYDYLESTGQPTASGNGRLDKPAKCVACQVSMTLLQACTHRQMTGHTIRYKGRIVTFGVPDREMPAIELPGKVTS